VCVCVCVHKVDRKGPNRCSLILFLGCCQLPRVRGQEAGAVAGRREEAKRSGEEWGDAGGRQLKLLWPSHDIAIINSINSREEAGRGYEEWGDAGGRRLKLCRPSHEFAITIWHILQSRGVWGGRIYRAIVWAMRFNPRSGARRRGVGRRRGATAKVTLALTRYCHYK